MTDPRKLAEEVLAALDARRPEDSGEREDSILPLLERAREEWGREERERCARLMEGAPDRLPGTFTNGAGFCRLVDHSQDMCECAERAAAIRAAPQEEKRDA